MKISYKQDTIDWTSYTQRIRMTEREFDWFADRVRAEIAQWLPRKKEYIDTSGYETFMKNIDVKAWQKRNFFATLNNTQTRFLKLFYKDNDRLKDDRNTVIFYTVED